MENKVRDAAKQQTSMKSGLSLCCIAEVCAESRQGFPNGACNRGLYTCVAFMKSCLWKPVVAEIDGMFPVAYLNS